MGRNPRIFLKGYPLHIVQRGHNRQRVFGKDSDYRYYISNLREQKTLLDIKVYAYCLMTNHVHLVLQPDDEPHSVSRLMKVLAARQTRRFNKIEKRSGTLWEGRFKASLIDTDRYLLACCRYVELNPVRAKIACAPEQYEWSSYRVRSTLGPPGWLDLDPAYEALGGSSATRARAYGQFVAEGNQESELELIRAAVQRNQLTGSDTFVDTIARNTNKKILTRGQGRPRKSATVVQK